MSRPTAYPNWATNVNYAGGPDVGTPTKIAPSIGRMADGWRNNDVPPAQEQNYEMDLLNQWVQWLDGGSVADTTALAALTDLPDGTIVRVVGASAYATAAYRLNYAGTAGTPDGYWLVAATVTGHGAAQWINTAWNPAAGHKLAAIGPVPGEVAFTGGTPSGRVNKDLIDHGYFAYQASVAPINGTVTANTATLMFQPPSITGVKNGDIVNFQAVVTMGSNVGVASNGLTWSEYSLDGGATWTEINPTSNFPFHFLSDNSRQSTPVGFQLVLTGIIGTAQLDVRVRATSDGVHQLNHFVDSYLLWVNRP